MKGFTEVSKIAHFLTLTDEAEVSRAIGMIEEEEKERKNREK